MPAIEAKVKNTLRPVGVYCVKVNNQFCNSFADLFILGAYYAP